MGTVLVFYTITIPDICDNPFTVSKDLARNVIFLIVQREKKIINNITRFKIQSRSIHNIQSDSTIMRSSPFFPLIMILFK